MIKLPEIDVENSTKYKGIYKCNSFEQYREKILKLQVAKEILDSDKEEIQKVYEIFVLYHDYGISNFDRCYNTFLKNGRDDSDLDGCYEYISIISNQLKIWKENGLLKDVSIIWKFLRDMERNNFSLASQTLEDYINFKGNDIDVFCKEYLIDLEEFKRLRRIVERFALSSELYKNFLEKYENYSQELFQSMVDDILDVITAFETGFFKDGTEFSDLEVWARLPFRNNSSEYFKRIKCYLKDCSNVRINYFGGIIRSFIDSLTKMNILSTEQSQVIINYLNVNNINELFICTNAEIRLLISGINVKKELSSDTDQAQLNYNISNEEVNGMLGYMEFRKIPITYKTFYLVLEGYINGKIDITDFKTERKLNANSRKTNIKSIF